MKKEFLLHSLRYGYLKSNKLMVSLMLSPIYLHHTQSWDQCCMVWVKEWVLEMEVASLNGFDTKQHNLVLPHLCNIKIPRFYSLAISKKGGYHKILETRHLDGNLISCKSQLVLACWQNPPGPEYSRTLYMIRSQTCINTTSVSNKHYLGFVMKKRTLSEGLHSSGHTLYLKIGGVVVTFAILHSLPGNV